MGCLNMMQETLDTRIEFATLLQAPGLNSIRLTRAFYAARVPGLFQAINKKGIRQVVLSSRQGRWIVGSLSRDSICSCDMVR